MAAPHRLQALLLAMERTGLDVFVGVSSAFHNFLECDPLVSLAGFRPMGPSAAVVRRNGDLELIVTPAWDAARARARCPGARVVGSDDLAGALAASLRADAAARRIGGALADALPSALADALQAALGPHSVPADTLLLEVAAAKTADELADAQRATWVAEEGYRRMLDILRPGIREYELAGELLCYMKSLGSHDNFFLMSAAQHNQAVRPPSRRILERGDILLAEITPAVNSQFSQICRTVALGPPAALVGERFALLQTAMAAGQQAATAGRTVADAARAMNRVIAGAGFGDYCRPPYMRVRGHGLGNVSSLPGDIAEDNPIVLREGMVFVMHPNQYFPDVGYLLCGEPVVIGSGPAEALSAYPARLDQVRA